MQISCSLGLNKFLVMPPAYYKYQDDGLSIFILKLLIKFLNVKLYFIILRNYVVINLVLNVLKN